MRPCCIHSTQAAWGAVTSAASRYQQEDFLALPATKSHWVTFMPSRALTIMIAAGKGAQLLHKRFADCACMATSGLTATISC